MHRPLTESVPETVSRRGFSGVALAAAVGATTLGACSNGASIDTTRPRTQFRPLTQIDAGLLSVGYADEGPCDGPPVILLHGWPYDIHSYLDMVLLLTAKGSRVLMPYLRGYGRTRSRSSDTYRNGQQAALATDVIDFMDALKIPSATLGGFERSLR
ncbi:hypothetical protein HNP40_003361 [Mycobacteroides chelonae]|nr:hypothetical protein [Mycobacteroides chelonae]